MPITTRSVLGGAALMIVGIVLGAVAGTSEPVFSDETKTTTVLPSSITIGPPRVGKYGIAAAGTTVYMNDTSTGELWMLAEGEWRHAAGPVVRREAANARATTTRETTVETTKGK